MSPFLRIAATTIIIVSAARTFASGTSVRLLNLIEMVELADRVFWGRCVSYQVPDEGTFPLPVVEYVFEVHRGIKGVGTGDKVAIRQVRSDQPGVQGIPGLPHYQKGQEILIFLHGDSRLGLTSPVGLGQGVFKLERTREREMHALNVLGNQNLAFGLNDVLVAASGITAPELQRLRRMEPIPVELLASLVARIERYQFEAGRSLR